MRSILLLFIAIGIGFQFFYYANMPDLVAIHYSLGGLPDNWASKEWNLGFRIILILFLNGMFLLMPVFFKSLPTNLINLPNKDYWLAEERKASTVKKIVHWFDSMMVLTNIFLIVVFHLDFNANTSTTIQLNEMVFLTALGVYLAAISPQLLA